MYVCICIHTLCPKKWPPKHFATAAANLHRFKWKFTHTTRHLFLPSTPNFIKKSLVLFTRFSIFQTAVTNLSYRYDLLPCCRHQWLLHLPAGQCPSQPCLCYCQLRHPTSTAHWIGHRTVQISIRWTNSIWGILQERVYHCQICDVDNLKERLIEDWRRFDF